MTTPKAIESTDWTACATYCCGCGSLFTSRDAVAIWHRMKWCEACARGLNPEGFTDNALPPPASPGELGHCPRCDSPQPHLHPAVAFEGEVQPCAHPYHDTVTAQNTPEKIAALKLSTQPSPGELPTIYSIRQLDMSATIDDPRSMTELISDAMKLIGVECEVVAYPPPKPLDEGKVKEAIRSIILESSLVYTSVDDCADRILAALRGAV